MLYNDDDVERAAVALVSEWGMGPVDDEDRADLRRVLDGCLPDIYARWLNELGPFNTITYPCGLIGTLHGYITCPTHGEDGCLEEADPCYCAETSTRNCPRHSGPRHKKVSSFGDDTCSCGYDGWPCGRDS